jgi:hypothetical protein
MKDLQDQIQSQLTQFIGAQNNEQTMQQMQKAIAKLFPHVEGLQLQRVYAKNSWLTMTFKDKVIWWISTCLFPKISKTIRDFHYELQSYTDAPNCKMPLWAEKDPKSICIADVYFNTPKPVEFINLNVSVEKSQETSII